MSRPIVDMGSLGHFKNRKGPVPIYQTVTVNLGIRRRDVKVKTKTCTDRNTR